MQVKIFCNNAGVNQTPGWKTCIEIDAVSFLKQLWKSGKSLKYLNLWISQLGVVAGSEVALSRMSLKEGGEGGVLVNTASLAGVRVLQMMRPFMKTVTFVNLSTTFWTITTVEHGGDNLFWNCSSDCARDESGHVKLFCCKARSGRSYKESCGISSLIFASFAILFIPSERKGDWGGPFGRLPRIRWDPGNFLVALFPVDSQEEKINSNQSDTRWSWSV